MYRINKKNLLSLSRFKKFLKEQGLDDIFSFKKYKISNEDDYLEEYNLSWKTADASKKSKFLKLLDSHTLQIKSEFGFDGSSYGHFYFCTNNAQDYSSGDVSFWKEECDRVIDEYNKIADGEIESYIESETQLLESTYKEVPLQYDINTFKVYLEEDKIPVDSELMSFTTHLIPNFEDFDREIHVEIAERELTVSGYCNYDFKKDYIASSTYDYKNSYYHHMNDLIFSEEELSLNILYEVKHQNLDEHYCGKDLDYLHEYHSVIDLLDEVYCFSEQKTITKDLIVAYIGDLIIDSVF